jgi:Cytosol aminopeptidase family, catalytic domain
VLGFGQVLVDRLRSSAEATDEPMWQLPLETKRFRKLLDSDVADFKNVGGPQGGTIKAAVFLSEVTGEVPWAHLDIAPTMKVDADDSWRSKGHHRMRHAPAHRPGDELHHGRRGNAHAQARPHSRTSDIPPRGGQCR